MINKIKLKKFRKAIVMSVTGLALVIPLFIGSMNVNTVYAKRVNNKIITYNKRRPHYIKRYRKPAKKYAYRRYKQHHQWRYRVKRPHYNKYRHKYSRIKLRKTRKNRKLKRNYKMHSIYHYNKRVPQFKYHWTGHAAPVTDHTKITQKFNINIKPVKKTPNSVRAIKDFNSHKKSVVKAMETNPDNNDSEYPLAYMPVNNSLYGFEDVGVSGYGSSPQAPIDADIPTPYSIFAAKKNTPNAKKVLEKQAAANKPLLKGNFNVHLYANLTHKAWEDQARNAIYGDIRLDRRDNGVGDISRDPELDNIAEERAHQIRYNYSHTDSNGNIIFLEDANQHGDDYSNGWGENIAKNSGFTYYNTEDIGNQFNKQWFTDEKGPTPEQDGGHRKNILNPDFNYVGVGVYKDGDNFYACEDFAS